MAQHLDWISLSVLKLALRAVNSAHSAYACFLFSPLFFQSYSLGSVSEQGIEAVKCKLFMKVYQTCWFFICTHSGYRCPTRVTRWHDDVLLFLFKFFNQWWQSCLKHVCWSVSLFSLFSDAWLPLSVMWNNVGYQSAAHPPMEWLSSFSADMVGDFIAFSVTIGPSILFLTYSNLYWHDAAEAAFQIINTWWQCAQNIPSVFVSGITKTYNLHFQESEALQAVFSSHLCPNMLKCPARFEAPWSVIKL